MISNPRGKKIGLALGGGAFRGVAHIGVLKVLEENDIQPAHIAGTSIGALIGALYAFGTPVDRMLEIARNITWLSISHFTLSKMGLLTNDEIGEIIEKELGKDRQFEEAEIPLAIVAADIENGSKVVFEKGSVVEAVLASTCIPGIFIPIEIDDRILVDGGLVENVPVTPLRDKGLDMIIAVNLGSRRSYHKPDDIIDVIISALDIAIEVHSRSITKDADVIIEPDVGSYSRFDSKKVDKFYEEGYEAAQKALPDIQKILKRGRATRVRRLFQNVGEVFGRRRRSEKTRMESENG